MTQYIVFIATVIAMHVISSRGLKEAALLVWLPFFLITPTNFFVNIPGLPDPNFMQAAIIPILIALFKEQSDRMTFGRMEVMLAAYVILRVCADFVSRGYADAQNYAFYMLTSLIGPYLIGKYIISKKEIDIEFARMYVLIFILFFPMFIYELKFWVSPVFTLLSRFFPGANSGLSVRYGLARTAGTFEHPILACVMVVIAYRLHKWLDWMGFWDTKQTGLIRKIEVATQWLPFKFKTKISIAFILMALMTISRGPWIGAFVGAGLASVGLFKDRKKVLIIYTLALCLCGGMGKMALEAYITPKDGEMISGEAQTMLYRKVMIDKYKEFMYEKIWTGWGLTTRPQIPGMESIDNAYFLMALQHGILAPFLFVSIFIYAILSQIHYSLKMQKSDVPIGFTFAGIYLACFISFATVYMGAQTECILFLLLGWGESIKGRKKQNEAVSQSFIKKDTTDPFKRVMY